MIQILHNICRLSFIETGRLRGITIVHGEGVLLRHWRNFEQLPVVGLARCEVVSKIENKTRLYTTTLTARLVDHFDARDRHLAFLATCVDGQRYLIGVNESPYPIVNTSDSMPDRPTDVSGCTLTVEFTDVLGLLPVLD